MLRGAVFSWTQCIYRVRKKWNHSIFAPNLIREMLANFQSYFTSRLSSIFLAKFL